MKILFIVAMEKEFRRVSGLLDGKSEGMIGPHQVYLINSGMGKVNAAAATVEAILKWDPDYVISTGVAGGISSELNVMDVIAASEIVYHDVWCGDACAYGQMQGMPARFACDKILLEKATSMDAGVKLRSGLICSGDRFVIKKDLPEISSHFPEGMAVDMESAAIAHVCHLKGKPFLSLRVISDSVNSSADNLAQYWDFWDRLADESFHVLKTFMAQF